MNFMQKISMFDTKLIFIVKEMIQFIKTMLSNTESVSSKRFVGILAFFVIVTIAFINLFTGKTVLEYILNYIFFICIASLGLTTVEKFSESFKNHK